MYLIDTNIWLERLLEQARSQEVVDFLNRIFSQQLNITDFAFHTIGMTLTRLKKNKILSEFINDLFVSGEVGLIRLAPKDIHRLLEVVKIYHLDFDDAYQYVAAEKFNLQLISFDKDFDKTDRKRKEPSEIL